MPNSTPPQTELPSLAFKRPADWDRWLSRNHASAAGVWVKLAKQSSELPSITYAEALEVALCYGWIDGQKKTHDATAWLQKFTPRRARSLWSKINRAKAEALIQAGRMKPAGLAAVAEAQRNGQWDAAYAPQRDASVPADLQAELDRHPKAKAFFATLDRRNRYALLFRLHTAKKPETRARRLAHFVEMLERQEKLYP